MSTTRCRLLSWPVHIIALVLCSALTIVAFQIPNVVVWIVGALTGCMAIWLLFVQETCIDFDAGSVTSTLRLFGVFKIWERPRDREEFEGVRYYCSSGVTHDIADTWIVTLKARVGRDLNLRQFSVDTGDPTCEEAKTFAHEIGSRFGLPVVAG
jgi:hypothetical protein